MILLSINLPYIIILFINVIRSTRRLRVEAISDLILIILFHTIYFLYNAKLLHSISVYMKNALPVKDRRHLITSILIIYNYFTY